MENNYNIDTDSDGDTTPLTSLFDYNLFGLTPNQLIDETKFPPYWITYFTKWAGIFTPLFCKHDTHSGKIYKLRTRSFEIPKHILTQATKLYPCDEDLAFKFQELQIQSIYNQTKETLATLEQKIADFKIEFITEITHLLNIGRIPRLINGRSPFFNWQNDHLAIWYILENYCRTLYVEFQLKTSADLKKKESKTKAFEEKKEKDSLPKVITEKEYNNLLGKLSNLSKSS